MEVGGLPLLNCLWQQALRSFCSDSSSSSGWVYAVFWRILPRNYPPPRWDEVQAPFDRSNKNKRNWILVWEDGFCDFHQCRRAGSGFGHGGFGPDVFFKMSHEVYNYGEGLMGKVAADTSHKWIFREIPSENDPNISSTGNGNRSPNPQPRAWESQFKTGIQTIALVAVSEGVVQLGSLHKVPEDLNLVTSVQRKFNCLQSIPGIFAMQRPPAASSEHSAALRCLPPPIQHNACSHGFIVSGLSSVLPLESQARSLGTYKSTAIVAANLVSNLNRKLDLKPTPLSAYLAHSNEDSAIAQKP